MNYFSIGFLLLCLVVCLVNCHQNHQQQGQKYAGTQQPNQQPTPPPPTQHGSAGGSHDHGHGHESAGGQDQVKTNINMDHVMEHLDGVINKPKEQLTAEEQNFYYFKLHDYDNNNKLDGLELVSAFAHNEEHHDQNNPNQTETLTARIGDDELIKLIDEIMKDEDKNNDGFITYQEFIMAINRT